MTETVLPPAPPDVADIRILVDGDTCDARCPALAFVRVHILRAGELVGTLHFCSHHWRDHCDKLTLRAAAGEASIRDERQWVDR